MADEQNNEQGAADAEGTSAAELAGGSYEVIRARLVEQAKDLGGRADALNVRRQEAFGGTQMEVIATERVRTENNCTPVDIVQVAGKLLFAYNVFIGLKSETAMADVFSLHKFEAKEGGGFDLSSVEFAEGGGLLTNPNFEEHFAELYRFYKEARIIQLSRTETKLFACWKIGAEIKDVRVSRWTLDAKGRPSYVDNRGERDFEFPPQQDFEWSIAGRDTHQGGEFPHVSIRDKVFVETTGGDLTIKIENNTASGEGIYSEPVDDEYQTLDDAQFQFHEVGPLILIKVLPYREERWRHLVFATRSNTVTRIDAIGDACISLPEDHGIIFPGGYYLQDGQHKVFDGDYRGYEFLRSIRSPNGEDVLYVFHRRGAGLYALFSYNLIRREIGTPILCNGYSLFDDGKMVIFRYDGAEPTRVHPMQVWQTAFVSDEHAAAQPEAAGFLGSIGNAELVRGISDCLSIRRFITDQTPSRQIYEDLISSVTRTVDTYHWIGDTTEVGDLKSVLVQIRDTSELIVDEFEKVVQIRKQAAEALGVAAKKCDEVIRGLRPESWEKVDDFMGGLTALRTQRGHLITLREMRYIDLARIDELEKEVVANFDRVSKATVDFLLRADALTPLVDDLGALEAKSRETDKTNEMQPILEDITRVSEGLNVLSEIAANLQVDDPTARTTILEGISEVFGHLNRVRATVDNRRKELLGSEGRAEFGAQFKLLSQAVTSSIGMADTPDKCDEQLSRLMVQLEELEAKFSEFDEFLGDLTTKREEIYEAFGQKKQQLLDERQRRVQNLWGAADRILQGVSRRAKTFKGEDDLNAYFASDAMILKLRELGEKIFELGDTVKADEVESKLKSARQDALRGLRDRLDLFEEGTPIIKFGKHRFSVNTQPLELGILPHGDGMAVTLSGTDFVEPVDDEAFNATREYWSQQIVSETDAVYRGEFLAASILFDAESNRDGLSLAGLLEASRSEAGLGAVVRKIAADRYQEGYERGVHDADAAAILEKLITVYTSAGLLRFAPTARALACLWWSEAAAEDKPAYQRRSQSLGRLRTAFSGFAAQTKLNHEIADDIEAWLQRTGVEIPAGLARAAARYLVEELAAERAAFTTSADAQRLRDGLLRHLEAVAGRRAFEEDLESLQGDPAARFGLARAWLEAFLEGSDEAAVRSLHYAVTEAAVVLCTERTLDRVANSSLTTVKVEGLLGNHGRISQQTLELRIDEFIERLAEFRAVRVPGFSAYREARAALVERERYRLRVDEFKPRVLSSFVRNRLINETYLPLVGDNLAKQLGAAGDQKRTDLMGLLLLISPPGYGKTTLMEYIANRLGLVFMKINGPALGHGVMSLDPSEAPNATARQEVEKINLAFEMGNNVMLYLDDIQHTHPELLQKFISLCDAQRRIEGVWKGRTRTYDLRGKKFCVVMAGNPYTEAGEKFQIPDMLANRADTYNLGDILGGKEDVFALSYIENAITSNRTLAPLATREQSDIYQLVRMAQGEDIPSTDLKHGYSAVEVSEITAVFQRMFKCQEVLLKVNKQYIASASMDDKFRVEPRFQLQGSYRNMNKLAEKIVSAMNDAELEQLIGDHYTGEAQTLTTGAEANLLKLASMRGTMTPEQKERWALITKEFARQKLMGGGDDDPVTRVTGQLTVLSEHLGQIHGALGRRDQLDGVSEQLGAIQQTLGARNPLEGLGEQLAELKDSVVAAVQGMAKRAASQPVTAAAGGAGANAGLAGALAKLEATMERLARPQLHVRVENLPPPGVEELLAQQIAIIERTLVPLVRTTNQQLVSPTKVDERVAELLALLKQMDGRMRAGQPMVPPGSGPAPLRAAAASSPGVPTHVTPEPSPPPSPTPAAAPPSREAWRPPPQFRPPTDGSDPK
jgi:SpoVK/Ycf46/Vps4 family AAA+-type ATPase